MNFHLEGLDIFAANGGTLFFVYTLKENVQLQCKSNVLCPKQFILLYTFLILTYPLHIDETLC